MYVYRLHIRPQGGTADLRTTFGYCLENGILGVGWRTNSNQNTKHWDEYYSEANSIHDSLNICSYIKKWIKKGDLVWTRDHLGQYYIARVESGWEYFVTQEAVDKDIDIANIFRVDIKQVDIDDVPGKVVACFRAPRTIQAINGENVLEYSKYLWNSVTASQTYDVQTSKFSDIFMMLDDEETEDLVFLYLQEKGWYVLPHSRKGDTMSFEYLCVNSGTGERVVVQVKTGQAFIDVDKYKEFRQKVFVFQTNGRYIGEINQNIVVINREDLLVFFRKSISWLPNSFKRKYEIVSA